MATTAEILQHYVTAGIEVEITYDGGIHPKGDRLPLLGLNTNDEYPVITGEASFKLAGVLPVLRPFSTLGQPLGDGFIPAVVAATMLANDWAAQYHFVIHETKGNRITVRQFEWDDEEGEVPVADYSILADWNLIKENMDGSLATCENLLDTYEYLRGQHFAVGLEAENFFAKQ